MTEREHQIVEMEAIIIQSHCDNPLSKDCYGECEYCIAKDLYDAGYRKSVPTADVVPRALVWEMVERLKKRLPVISPCIFEDIAKEVLEGDEL